MNASVASGVGVEGAGAAFPPSENEPDPVTLVDTDPSMIFSRVVSSNHLSKSASYL